MLSICVSSVFIRGLLGSFCVYLRSSAVPSLLLERVNSRVHSSHTAARPGDSSISTRTFAGCGMPAAASFSTSRRPTCPARSSAVVLGKGRRQQSDLGKTHRRRPKRSSTSVSVVVVWIAVWSVATRTRWSSSSRTARRAFSTARKSATQDASFSGPAISAADAIIMAVERLADAAFEEDEVGRAENQPVAADANSMLHNSKLQPNPADSLLRLGH